MRWNILFYTYSWKETKDGICEKTNSTLLFALELALLDQCYSLLIASL